MSTAPLISIRSVSKRFGATHALRGVSLDLHGGEVHVLAGENGAGKSTLIRILAGIVRPDGGSLWHHGGVARFGSAREARQAGIATIHQELSLIGALSVADNIALGSAEPQRMGAWRWVSNRQERERARAVLALLHIDVSPDARVEGLPLATRQLIEVARALAQRAQVVVLDEPTSALNDSEAERLFAELDELRARGVAVLFISHKMDDIYRVADRISVLRDGRLVVTARAAELPRDALVRHVAGADVEAIEPVRGAPKTAPWMLEVRGLSVTGGAGRQLLSAVDVRVRAGEIVGVSGLAGSGVEQLAAAIVGAVDARGSVQVAGAAVPRGAPRHAHARGMVMLAGDRALSLVQSLSVIANTTLSALPRFSRGGWIDGAAERRHTAAARDALRVDCPSLDAEVGQLSGGNQQKVAMARCLALEPRVLLLHEPSRGIDVGAKAELHALIRRLAARGVAILLVSSDVDELMALCDRVLVMKRGRVVRAILPASFSREAILSVAMEGAAEAADTAKAAPC